VDVSVVIATFNRAGDLGDTLGSLSQVQTARSWELIVVDNNSTDDTRGIVEKHSTTFPVDVRYVV